MGSHLVLFHVPHQVFCLNPQISAQREGSQEKSQLNTTLSGAESLPLAPAYTQSSEQEAALHPSCVLEGRHWPDFFIRPINRLKSAQKTHFGCDLTQISLLKPLWMNSFFLMFLNIIQICMLNHQICVWSLDIYLELQICIFNCLFSVINVPEILQVQFIWYAVFCLKSASCPNMFPVSLRPPSTRPVKAESWDIFSSLSLSIQW